MEGVKIGWDERSIGASVHGGQLGLLEAHGIRIDFHDILTNNGTFIRLAEAMNVPGQDNEVVKRQDSWRHVHTTRGHREHR